MEKADPVLRPGDPIVAEWTSLVDVDSVSASHRPSCYGSQVAHARMGPGSFKAGIFHHDLPRIQGHNADPIQQQRGISCRRGGKLQQPGSPRRNKRRTEEMKFRTCSCRLDPIHRSQFRTSKTQLQIHGATAAIPHIVIGL